MPLTPLTPSDPQRLGGYWLAGRLGAGGQGVVYEAYGEGGERVAVKVPRLDDPASRARLAKEAAAARRVASFCTARVIEARTDVPEAFIVSEYVPGPNLRQVIEESGRYEGDLLLRLAIGVATALAAVHEVGIVHRDLKPGNIILGPDGPRVIDFGVARRLEVPATTTGPMMGTPNYMAPELFAGRPASPAADVWAWGLTVMFAATGHDLIPDREPLAVVTRVLALRPDVGGLAEPLAGLVARALAQDPADRPSARDLLLGLLGGLKGPGRDPADGDPLAYGGSAAAGVRPPEAAPAPEPDLGTIAEELYRELSESERAVAPEVFLRMIGVAEDGAETVRHVPREELPGEGPVASLLTVYGAAGLVVDTGTAFTLAHPALVQAWPRLREWMGEDRAGLAVNRRLTEAARVWDRDGRRPGDLLHGSGLDRALRWAAAERRNIVLLPLERDFLDAATTLARRTSRRRGLLAAALGVLLVLAVAGGGLAVQQSRAVARERDAAAARALTLRAADLRRSDPRLAMRMSVAAWRLAPSLPQSRGALYDSLSQFATDSFTDPDVTASTAYALGVSGRTLAAVHSGEVTIWDVRGHRQIRRFRGVAPEATNAALSPDGRILAVQDRQGVRLWDVTTGSPAGGVFGPGAPPTAYEQLRFDAGGRRLAVPAADGLGRGRWWDVATRRKITVRSGAQVDAVSPDGSLGVVHSTGSGRAELWDLRSGRRVPADWMPQKRAVGSVRFSEDGRALAVTHEVSGSEGAGVSLALKRMPSGTPLTGDGTGPVGESVTFFHHDRFVAATTASGLRVLSVEDGRMAIERDLGGAIKKLRYDEADRSLRVLLSETGTVTTLDVADLFDRPLLPGIPDAQSLLAPGGRVLALYGAGAVRLWDVRRRRWIAGPVTLESGAGEKPVLAFSTDGGRLAIGEAPPLGRSGIERVGLPRVTIVEVSGGNVTSAFEVSGADGAAVRAMAFSPDGAVLAVALDAAGPFTPPPPLTLRDLRTGTFRVARGVVGSAPMTYRPDGGLLVAGVDREFTLVDPRTLVPVRRPGGSGSIATGEYSFSPDGRQVAVGNLGRLSIWDAGFRRTLGRPFPKLDSVISPIWSPDGRTIASYGDGNGIRLWDTRTRQPLGLVFDGRTSLGAGSMGDEPDAPTLFVVPEMTIAFGADGRTLLSATPEGVLRTHDLDGDRVAARICARAQGRPDPEAWRRDVPEIDYADVCPA